MTSPYLEQPVRSFETAMDARRQAAEHLRRALAEFGRTRAEAGLPDPIEWTRFGRAGAPVAQARVPAKQAA